MDSGEGARARTRMHATSRKRALVTGPGMDGRDGMIRVRVRARTRFMFTWGYSEGEGTDD